MANGKNGHGSGSITPRGDSWLLRYRAGGKQYSTSLPCDRYNRTQAQKELNKILVAAQKNATTTNPVTVRDLLLRWYDEYAVIRVEDSTQLSYRQIIDHHLIPNLGHIKANKLKRGQVEEYLRKAQESGRVDGKGGLAPASLTKIYHVLSQSLDWGVEMDIVGANSIRKCTVPKKERVGDGEDFAEEMRILTESELSVVLEAASTTRWHIPIFVAANTGMRQGEVLGLTWRNVDLDAGTITVVQSLRNLTGRRTPKVPKTKPSRRTIHIDPITVGVLREHMGNQQIRKLVAGDAYKDYGYVCAREDGRPMYGPNVTMAFQAILKKAGLRQLCFHDLRHTHASLLIKAGEDILSICRRLGHSRPSITLDVYGHLIPGSAETSRKWSEIMGGGGSREE